MLSPVVGQDIYDVGQSIADLGETDKFQKLVPAVRKILDKEETKKAKSLS